MHEHQMEEMNAAGLDGAAIDNPNLILAFMFGEKLNHASPKLTFKALKTGTRYTFKINAGDLTDDQKAKGWKPLYFVKILTGPNNEEDYTYMGYVMFKGGQSPIFSLGKSSKYNKESQPVKAFTWALNILVQGRMPTGLEIWHSSRCGRCNRELTSEYAKIGFGKDCLEMMGGLSAVESFAKSFAPVETQPTTNAGSFLNVPRDPQAAAFKAKPSTPKAIVAAVNEDAEIAKMAADLWATNPVNPANIAPKVAAEPLPVDEMVAIALAKSQTGWTVDDAKAALAKRRIVNLNIKSTKVAEKTAALIGDQPVPEFSRVDGQLTPAIPTPEHSIPETRQEDPVIIAKVNSLKESDPETFTSDGIMDADEAFVFWYRRYASSNAPVEE